MGRLSGKVAIVTGAGRRGSIGRAIALALGAEGADVVINDIDRRLEEAAEVARQIEGSGSRACVIRADVSKFDQCRRLIQTTIERMGGLDILINNAGRGYRQNFEQISEDEYDAQLDLHLKGPFFLAQGAAPHMRARGAGRIVNISSELCYIGDAELTHYTAAKAGLRALTKSLARALAPSITVNTVCPGPTATERFKSGPEYTDAVLNSIPLRRWGRPEDVARSVVFLVTEDGNAFTGQTLDPNCGTVMD
jgi:3-oxoacyl-[acyl-carrier protein] reductase